jgi:hypothetical protein
MPVSIFRYVQFLAFKSFALVHSVACIVTMATDDLQDIHIPRSSSTFPFKALVGSIHFRFHD